MAKRSSWKRQADELEAKLREEAKSPKPGFVDRALLLAGMRWMQDHGEDE